MIALGLVAVLAPIVLVFFRDSPESAGLVIDGGASGTGPAPAGAAVATRVPGATV